MKWSKLMFLALFLPLVLLADPIVSYHQKRIDPWTDADPFLRLNSLPVESDSVPDDLYILPGSGEGRSLRDLFVLVKILGFELW